MSLDPSLQNNDVTNESSAGDSLSATSKQNGLDGVYSSSLTDWRAAFPTITPRSDTQNLQLASLSPPSGITDFIRPNSITGPGPEIRGPFSETQINPERFMSFHKENKPTVNELPIGGPHLKDKSKDVVTSWYTSQGTAMMEPFDPESLTAAHRTLPFNTVIDLKFYNPKTGQTKIVLGVKINNDGPHIKGNDNSPHVGRKPRELDVSPKVARELGLTDAGVDVGMVTMTIRQWGDNKYPRGGTHPAGADFRNKGRELDKYWGRSNFSIYS